MGDFPGLAELFIVLAVLLILFFLGREIFCWYWKINERVSLLEEIKDSLDKLVYISKEREKLDASKAVARQVSDATPCPACGNPVADGVYSCVKCGAEFEQ